MTRQQVGFLLRLALCVVGLVSLFQAFPTVFAYGYVLPISATAGAALTGIGFPAILDVAGLVDGFCVLETETTLLRVEFECTGLISLFVYLGAVVAYPSDGRSRLIGVVAGIPAYFLYSTARLVIIGITDYLAPAWLDWLHIYLMVLMNLGFFLFLWSHWVRRIATHRST